MPLVSCLNCLWFYDCWITLVACLALLVWGFDYFVVCFLIVVCVYVVCCLCLVSFVFVLLLVVDVAEFPVVILTVYDG